MSTTDHIVFVNGEYLPEQSATISILDRGFLFGDSVYEVIPFFSGKGLGLLPHLKRLNNSLSQIGMSPPYTEEQWQTIFQALLNKNAHQGKDQSIYIQVTRGVQPVRAHRIPDTYYPTVVCFSSPLVNKTIDILKSGFKATTAADKRHRICYIKTTNLLANTLALKSTEQTQAIETILIRDNIITEGSSSNVFIVKNGTLLTHPATDIILHGITRQIVIDLAKQHGIDCQETQFKQEDLFSADEVWITSSTRDITPIIEIDGYSIGTGEPGAYWYQLIKYYQALK